MTRKHWEARLVAHELAVMLSGGEDTAYEPSPSRQAGPTARGSDGKTYRWVDSMTLLNAPLGR